RVSSATLHQAGIAVGLEVQAFLRDLVELQSDRETSTRLLVLEQRQTALASLNDTIFRFTETFAETAATDSATVQPPVLANLAESLNTLLLTAADTLRSDDPADREMLLRL